MQYAFGCAQSLYADNIHPRVLVGPRDIAALRKRIASGDGRRVMEGIRAQLTPIIDGLHAANDASKMLHQPSNKMVEDSHPLIARLHDLALWAVLDDHERAHETVRRALLGLRHSEPPENQWWTSARYHHVGIVSLAYDMVCSRWSEADRREFCEWAVRSSIDGSLAIIRKSKYMHVAGMNTPLVGMVTALQTALAVQGEPGVRDLTPEITELTLKLEASLNAGVGRDGYPEEDTGYGTNCTAYMLPLADAVTRAGLRDIWSLCPQLKNHGRAILHIVQPWGEFVSNTGDNHSDVFWREWTLARLATMNRDPSLLWLLGTLCYPGWRLKVTGPGADIEVNLRKGVRTPASAMSILAMNPKMKAKHPSRADVPTAFVDRDRGLASLRSAWNDDATYVLFDGSHRSPSAQGHFHASAGHFSLTAMGEYFGVDMGRYGCDQADHNLVLVNGVAARPTGGAWGLRGYAQGRLIEFSPDKFVDFAAADSALQHDCYWAWRNLALVKGPDAPAYVVTIEDLNKADDFAEFWWTLNTCPGNTISLHEQSATITGWRRGNHLDVHFALPDPSAFPKPHTLAISQDEPTISATSYIGDPRARMKNYERPGDAMQSVVFARPRLIGKVSGYNGRFMSIMLPRKNGDAPAKVERLPSLDNSLAVRITFEDVEDTLIWAYEHRLLVAGDVDARGRWVVVRRSRKSGRVRAFQIDRGTMLSVGGKRVV